MDLLFLELVGKPVSNPPKIITVVAENFSLLEDQARFLRASLAIPHVKELPFESIHKRLIQIGSIQNDVADQVRKLKWAMNQYEDLDESICDRIEEDLSDVTEKSLIFINDISRLQLTFPSIDQKQLLEARKFLYLIEKLRKKHFLILFYQNSLPQCQTTRFLRDLEFLSDAFVRVRSCKAVYLKTIWWQTIPTTNHTLISPKVETHYYTCKIGKFYWSTDLLCFYERKEVKKNYDPDSDINLNDLSIEDSNKKFEDCDNNDKVDIKKKLLNARLEDDDSDEENYRDDDERENTLPYTKARNPEQSRIFYYPDKDDDIDEDDPDNDLNF